MNRRIAKLIGAGAVTGLLLLAFTTSLATAAAPGWRALAVTAPTNLPPLTAEVQELSVDATAGTFTLSFAGLSTAPLPFNASPAEVAAALDALAGIGGQGGAVTVKDGPGGAGAELPYFVSFGGSLAGVDVEQLGADGTGLAGAGHSASVTTTVQGAPSSEVGGLLVSITNVGGAATTAATSVRIGPLPPGIVISGLASGTSNVPKWICPQAIGASSITCTYAPAVTALDSIENLQVPLRVEGALAPARSAVPMVVEGGGAIGSFATDVPLVVSSQPARPAIQAFWAGAFDANGNPFTQAGGHPNAAATAFRLTTVVAADGTRLIPAGTMREARVELPPGFVGNPMTTERCPQEAIASGAGRESILCTPERSAVATLGVSYQHVKNGFGPNVVFNDVPPFGAAAEFTANIVNLGSVSVLGRVRSDRDYGVTAIAPNLPNTWKVNGSMFGFEGFPAAAGGRPFLTNPTNCEDAAPTVLVEASTWPAPDVYSAASAPQPAVTGCDRLHFEPSFSFQPTATEGGTGVGAEAHIHIDQAGLVDPARLAPPHLRKSVVTLPEGLTLNPSAANGLEACSEEQVGFKGAGFPQPNPIRFDESAPRCPEGSKLGTVSVRSPLLEAELKGTIYLAAQEANPFGSLIALYLVIDDARTGIVLKLPGEVRSDPNTGQLTASFDHNPQLPFADLTLNFRGGGPRSELATPEVCGSYETRGEWTPWSAPQSGPPAQTSDGFTVRSSCAKSAAARPFAPSFEAGTMSTTAGAFSPLLIKVARKDGEQELTSLDFTLPPGLTGKLAGIPYCSDAAIATAKGKTGKAELTSSSCPGASQLGTVDSAAGVGSEPIHVGGHVYLAGPYRGAPLSAVVITPAVAGPFDLGNVVVRAPLFVNPETAQITASSDPIPTILRGIPLKLRAVRINVDRAGFTLNPTSCQPLAVNARLGGSSGASASPSNRFQVGNCAALPFKPKLSLRVFGKTRRNAKPRFRAVLTARPGEANIARAQVNLPHSEFLEQGHIKTICTRVQWNAGAGHGSACPSGSIYGRAKAWTPLLAEPLEGPVYLRSSSHKLPDLVAALNGQVNIELVGKVDSGPNEGIRNTFEVVPDAPVSRFMLEMKGGKKGLLVNSENLCAKKAKTRAIVRFTGQNGKVAHFKPKVQNNCRKAKKKKHHKRHG